MFTLNIPQRKYVYPVLTILLLTLFLMRYAISADSVVPAPKKSGSDVVNSMNDARNIATATRQDVGRTASSAEATVARAGSTTRDSLAEARADMDAATRNLRDSRVASSQSSTAMRNAEALRRAGSDSDARMAADLESQVRARQEQLSNNARTQQEWIDGYSHPDLNEALIRRDVANILPNSPASDVGISDSELRAAQRADVRYNEERIKLNEQRMRSQREYREKRTELENKLSGLQRGSSEYDRLQNQIGDLDRSHVEREQKFENEYRNMDAKFSSASRW